MHVGDFPVMLIGDCGKALHRIRTAQITMEQFANLIEVLELSKPMNRPISQRG